MLSCGPESLCRTEPCDVFVVPGQSLLAARVQRSSARHPPQGVDVSAHVEVGSPQQAQSSEALFSCKNTHNSENLPLLLLAGRSCLQLCVTHLQVDTCKQTGSCLGPTLKRRKSLVRKSWILF